VVSRIPGQVAIEGQLVLLNVNATDSPGQSLSFSLDPGTPEGATINPATGLFSWRPGPAQSSTTNLIYVYVTDNGAPPMTATASFTVRVEPRPHVNAITTTATGFAINFISVPGKTYRIEFKDSLSDTFWSPLDIDITADAATLTVHDDSAGNGQRFYRITVLN